MRDQAERITEAERATRDATDAHVQAQSEWDAERDALERQAEEQVFFLGKASWFVFFGHKRCLYVGHLSSDVVPKIIKRCEWSRQDATFQQQLSFFPV